MSRIFNTIILDSTRERLVRLPVRAFLSLLFWRHGFCMLPLPFRAASRSEGAIEGFVVSFTFFLTHSFRSFGLYITVQDLGSSRSCPIARRGIVAAAPRRTVDSEGNGGPRATAPGQPIPRQPRRIRDPKASLYRLPSHTTPGPRQPSYAHPHHRQQQPQRRVPASQHYQQQQHNYQQQQTPQHHYTHPSQNPIQESYLHSQKSHGDELQYSPATRQAPQRRRRERQQQASYYLQYHANDPPVPQHPEFDTSRYQETYDEAQSFVDREFDNEDYADASLDSTAVDFAYVSEAPDLSHDLVDYPKVRPSPYTDNPIHARQYEHDDPSFLPNDPFRKRRRDDLPEPQTEECVDEVDDNLYEEDPVYDDNRFPQRSSRSSFLPSRDQRGSTGRGIWPPQNETNPMGGLFANQQRGSWPGPTQNEAALDTISSHRGIWPLNDSQAVSASVPSQETSDAFSLSDNQDMATNHGSIHQSAVPYPRQKGGGIWPGPAKATTTTSIESRKEVLREERDFPLAYVAIATDTNRKPPPPPPRPPQQQQRHHQQPQPQAQVKRNQHQQNQQSKRSQQHRQPHASTRKPSIRQYDGMDHKVKPGCIDFSKPFSGTYNDFANPNKRNSEAFSPPPNAHIQVPREVHTGKSSSVDQRSTLSSIDDNGSNAKDDINDTSDDNDIMDTLGNSPAYASENKDTKSSTYQHTEAPPLQKLRYFDVDVEIDYDTGEPLHR